MDRDEITDRVKSVEAEYPASSLRYHNVHRMEEVSHENLLHTLESSAFNSQDLFLSVTDSDGDEPYKHPFPGAGASATAFMMRDAFGDTSPHYNVVYSRTSEGLALHAKTLSTYEVDPPDHEPIEGYVGVVNIPKQEEYGDVGTNDLVNKEEEYVESLLEGEDPSPSMWESIRQILDRVGRAKQVFRR